MSVRQCLYRNKIGLCIYVEGHGGFHNCYPDGGPDRSDEIRIRVLKDRIIALEAQLDRYRWRPISEIHEDLGDCILINLADPGNLVLGNNLCDWYNADDWTHFAQVPELTHEEAARLAAAMTAESKGEHQ